MKIFNFFIDKTKLVNMLTIGILIIGIIAVFKIKREAFPNVDFDRVFVITTYPGATPEDVELNVTIPLENNIRGINGLEEVNSISREGYSMIEVVIDPDIKDKEKVKNEIQKATDQVVDFPSEVENRPWVWEFKSENFAIIKVALSSEKISEQELRSYARLLKKKIEDLPNVAKTDTLGFRQREIQIRVNLENLLKNHLSLSDIVNRIRIRNIRIPAGLIKGKGQSKSIITEAKFQSLDDVKKMILRTNFEGNQVKVGDIADVVDDFEEYWELNKMNGNIGVAIEIVKKSNADIIKTINQVKKCIDDFKAEKNNNVQIDYINDFSIGTKSMLNIVSRNAIFGMILVIATLMIFLNLRSAFWTAMGIPFALCITLFIMVLTDVSINGHSLIGMVIVLGMLVDDAIVVAESIYRYRLEGYSPFEAAKEGLRVVAAPIFVTVLTTIIAFSPLFFLPGIAGDFILPIPLVITFTLLASLFEAYFILPNHLTAHSQKKIIKTKVKKIKERKWFPAFQRGYVRILKLALHHRFILVAIFIILFFGSIIFAAVKMKFIFFPQNAIEQSTWYLEAVRETSLDRMNELTYKIEEVIKKQPKGAILSFSTEIARGRWSIPENENYATIYVYYPPANQQKYDPKKIIEEINRKIKSIPEIIKSRHEIGEQGMPLGGDVEVKIIGNENEKRKDIVNNIMNYIKNISGVTNVENSEKSGKPEFSIEFDYEELARYGLNASDIGLTVRTALEGSIVSKTYTPEERIDYRVILHKEDRGSIDTIKKLFVVNDKNVLVPIKDIVKLKENETIAKIEHINGDRFTNIITNLDKKEITPFEVSAKLKEYIPSILSNYPGFHYEIGGEAKETQKFFVNITIAFIVALLVIYFTLSLLFNSFIQPVIVMITIPFGIVGVIWTFIIHNLPFSFLTLIGIVGLSGIVVNDSLIMVDYINRLIREKKCTSFHDYIDLVIEGAKVRLRPIILTTVTTALGVMPTAYGIGGYVESLAPMVLVIGWGIVFSSTLTLFLLPGFYLIEIQIELFLTKIMPWLPLKNHINSIDNNSKK